MAYSIHHIFSSVVYHTVLADEFEDPWMQLKSPDLFSLCYIIIIIIAQQIPGLMHAFPTITVRIATYIGRETSSLTFLQLCLHCIEGSHTHLLQASSLIHDMRRYN